MQKLEHGIVLFDTIFIGQGETPAGVVLTLRTEQGPSVIYEKSSHPTVDYPGEYELAGYNIVAFTAPKSTTLNYIIRFANKRVAYIQDPKSLEHDEVVDMDTWYVINTELKDIIERRELGGAVQIVE